MTHVTVTTMSNKDLTTQESIARLGRVAVVMGGNAAEREVSLKSGKAVLEGLLSFGVDAVAIDARDNLVAALVDHKVSRVFNVLHGRGGEDGTLQGLLEFMRIPYTGSRVLASALSMDKVLTKRLWLQLGLPTPPFCMLSDDSDMATIMDTLGTAVVKPVREGSSIGMSIVDSATGLEAAYHNAKRYDSEVMAEKYIKGGEFTVSILGTEVLPAIELRTHHPFYDYDAKYIANDTQYLCPAPLDEQTTQALQALSMNAFTSLGCTGWGRVDLMRDQQGKFWLLEVNTVPGMTDHSLVPMAAKARGIAFNELLLHILAVSSLQEGGTPT